MGALVDYQQWLTKLQCQPTFLNNYWCSMLAHDMEENKHSDGFKIPYFIVEKELMREDNNVHLRSRDDAYVSPALRHWLIELLKSHNENTSSLNYEEVLRDFLEKRIKLPVPHPLIPSISFHIMPSECKLWILYILWTFNKPTRPGKSIAMDPLGNSYFLAPGCRLYVAMARWGNVTLPIDEARLNREPWGPLYRFVHNQPCRLLCENQDGWDVVMKMLQFFNLTNLCYSILPDITAKLTEKNLIMMMREEQQRAFEESLAKLTSNVDNGGVPKLTQNQKRKQKKQERAALEAAAQVAAVGNDLKAANIKEAAAPTPLPAEKTALVRQKIGKCWNFPQCPLKHVCPYTHPNIPCSKFPNCPRGWKCLFLHDFCPNDANCEKTNCAYEHTRSKPTYYRAVREPEHANPRPVAAVPPMRKVSDQNAANAAQQNSRAPTNPANGQPNQPRVRCGFFPKWCRKGNFCQYYHPTENCKNFAAGKPCDGQKCLFLHGVCPKDGNCQDLNCIFEHYESKPVVARRIEASQQNQGSLSRATSMSNLSTVSSRSRRKSVSFDISDDETTEKKLVGILRTPVESNRERCQFFKRCTKTRCEYSHPKEKCKAFPKCPNGGACMFLHEVCKNDGVCIKEDCDYEHLLRHNITKRWCNKGSRCQNIDCAYLHPKACTGRCPTPGNCWMRHLTGPAAATELAKPAQPAPKPPATTAPKASPPTVAAAATYTQRTPPPVPPRHGSGAPPVGTGPTPYNPSRQSLAALAVPYVFPNGPACPAPPPRPYPPYPQRGMPPHAQGGAPPRWTDPRYDQPGRPAMPLGNVYGGYGAGGPRSGAAPHPVMQPPPPSYAELTPEVREFIAHKNRY